MPALALECAARNDIGRRANNEDAIYTSSRLAAVADGVGGAAAGEVASQRIVNSLAHFDTSRLEIPLDAALENAIVFANESIGFMASARPQMEGMSTTLTDRKSTRLNSSHSQISYAVFCLKKKKT